MESDRFISNVKNLNKQNMKDGNSNFFLNSEINSTKNASEPIRHLNDFDFNILKENAYKDVNDELLKLEYKISQLEEEIKNTDIRILAAKDIHDFITAEDLISHKKILEQDLKSLAEIYNDSSISAKISSGLTSKIQNRVNLIKQTLEAFSDSMISKLPGKLSGFVEIKNSLNKLENINKSVDELMSMKNPYGQYSDKYEQLSKYILKANSIQSEISKYFK